jgi:hypothetical protein
VLFGLGSPVHGRSGKLGEIDRIMFDPNTRHAERLEANAEQRNMAAAEERRVTLCV